MNTSVPAVFTADYWNIPQAGTNVLGFGEMGVGNTSAASALICVLTGLSAEQTTGVGTGITAQQLQELLIYLIILSNT